MSDDRKKQAEELLAGFDRPARTPRAGSVESGFLEYHAKRGSSKAPAREKRVQEPTFVIEKEVPRKPSWLPWIALLVVMPLFGGLLVLAFLHNTSTPKTSVPTATTITAASAPAEVASPAAASASPPPVVPAASSSAEPHPSSPSPHPPPASPSSRGDFIRNL